MSSQRIAYSLGHTAQKIEHLILAQFEVDTRTRERLRNELHLPEEAFLTYFLSRNPKLPSPERFSVPFSDEFRMCLDHANDLRASQKQKYVLTAHVLLASVAMDDISWILSELNFDTSSTIRRFEEMMESDPGDSEQLKLLRDKKLVAIAKIASSRPNSWKIHFRYLLDEHEFTVDEIEAEMKSAGFL